MLKGLYGVASRPCTPTNAPRCNLLLRRFQADPVHSFNVNLMAAFPGIRLGERHKSNSFGSRGSEGDQFVPAEAVTQAPTYTDRRNSR